MRDRTLPTLLALQEALLGPLRVLHTHPPRQIHLGLGQRLLVFLAWGILPVRRARHPGLGRADSAGASLLAGPAALGIDLRDQLRGIGDRRLGRLQQRAPVSGLATVDEQ